MGIFKAIENLIHRRREASSGSDEPKYPYDVQATDTPMEVMEKVQAHLTGVATDGHRSWPWIRRHVDRSHWQRARAGVYIPRRHRR